MTASENCNELAFPSASNSTMSGARKQNVLSRLVSQEELPSMTHGSKQSPQYVSGGEEEDGGAILRRKLMDDKRSGSPMRCVSEFDEVAASCKSCCEDSPSPSTSSSIPPLPNPLSNANLRSTHLRALRLEAELQPMRLILGRLMAHPNNKKGIFNVPVDAAALGLVDYHQVIDRPMDLGTVKSRLYSIAYQSQEEVAGDIWLVFENAMTYNPPKNAVHIAARALRDYFEELYVAVGGAKKQLPDNILQHHSSGGDASVQCATGMSPSVNTRRVSFAEQTPHLKSDSSLPSGPAPSGILRTVSSESEIATAGPDESASCTAPDATDDAASDEAAVLACVATLNSQSPNELTESDSPNSSPQAKRARTSWTSSMPTVEMMPPRKRRLSLACTKKTSGHSCRSCLGRSCQLCTQGCLPLEPTLLVCNGGNCAGAKIRKGATYYIAKDGSRQYCQRCFTNLPPVLPQAGTDHDSVRYKRDLLKRKNDEELVEDWLTCSKCNGGVHQICALHNSFVHASSSYVCPTCEEPSVSMDVVGGHADQHIKNTNGVYTFVTGSELPVPLSDVADSTFRLGKDVLSADALAETDVSSFIEAKVRERLQQSCEIPNAEKTVTVRIVSDCDRGFEVPEVVRKHFRMPADGDEDGDVVSPPKKVNYRSKAIALFQKNDGLDVCIFCMYVQEYEGNDDYDEDLEAMSASLRRSNKRVYIAYLDSVEHFRPRPARTSVYHELLVSYLASARVRGYESAHIWACPPSRGNSFVFWNHPASQRTPTKELLISWYHRALSRAIDCGVVTDVKSLYESHFHDSLKEAECENEDDDSALHPSGKMPCPPLLEGDFWIEEAVRIHAASLARQQKASKPEGGNSLATSLSQHSPEAWEPCPARQVGSLLIDRLMTHACSAPFRRPVNAAAMGLKDYHKIITKPMDLGTVYSRCIHGEYHTLGALVADVQLVVSNAKLFNPPGNFVHDFAIEMEAMFFKELDNVTKSWFSETEKSSAGSWQAFSNMSMSLDMRLEVPEIVAAVSDYDSTSIGERAAVGSETMSDFEPVDRASNCSPTLSVTSIGIEDKSEKPRPIVELLSGGPDAVSQRMVGEDKWLMDKKNPFPPKRPSVSKKGGKSSNKRRRCSLSTSSEDEPGTKRRRQTWLGEEVGASVRTMRTSFFSCSLVPTSSMSEEEKEKAATFSKYTDAYQWSESKDPEARVISSRIADARHAFHEFSQYRNLEFATLRHAKYSTAMLLYHLHNDDAPGMIPICTSCKQETVDCRWHKIGRVEQIRKSPCKNKRKPGRPPAVSDKSNYEAEELCNACHAKHPKKDQFIPLHVSF